MAVNTSPIICTCILLSVHRDDNVFRCVSRRAMPKNLWPRPTSGSTRSPTSCVGIRTTLRLARVRATEPTQISTNNTIYLYCTEERPPPPPLPANFSVNYLIIYCKAGLFNRHDGMYCGRKALREADMFLPLHLDWAPWSHGVLLELL